MKVIALTLGSLLALTPLAARAESTPPSDAPSASLQPPKPRRQWYGWQTLLADGASAAVVITAAQHDNTGLLGAATGSYVMAAPMIHLAHANAGAAGVSAGLRLVLPLAGGLLGYAAARDPSKDESSWGQFLAVVGGVFLGTLTASIVDALVLAYDEHATAPASSKPDTKAFRIAPSVGALRGGVSAGLTGTF